MKFLSTISAALVACIQNGKLTTVYASNQEWNLIYEEDFTTALQDSDAKWKLEDYSTPFDTVMEDNSVFYQTITDPISWLLWILSAPIVRSSRLEKMGGLRLAYRRGIGTRTGRSK